MHRRDLRRTLIPAAILATVVAGYLFDLRTPPVATGYQGADAHFQDARAGRAHASFQRAVAALGARRYEDAVSALNDVLRIYPHLAEAHNNMGFALLELGEYAAAVRAFDRASDLRPSLHHAYYGLALSEHERGNTRAALASMQAYAHLAPPGDRWLPLAQRSMREWEKQLASYRRAVAEAPK